jgi:hypothetical protein
MVGMVVFPDEHDPPLLVDPNAVEIFQVAGQLLQTVAGRNPEVVQLGCSMELVEFHFGAGLNFPGQFPGWFEVENLPGLGVGETLNHAINITKNEN